MRNTARTRQHEAIRVEALLSSRVLVVAPHMDDELLGCGGLMLLHEDKQNLYCVYATAGERSPVPLLPWQGRPAPDLAEIRARESEAAMAAIGVPAGNVTRLGLPDGGLRRRGAELRAGLERELARIEPDFVLVPFRYDLHADHVAVHRTVRGLVRRGRTGASMLEYFVYVRWPWIRGADIRRRVCAERLIELEIANVADRKRRALSAYRSQTELPYAWQASPVLTQESLARRCSEPESFFVSAAREPLPACFPSRRYGLVLVHYLHRLAKRRKDQLRALGKAVQSLFTPVRT